MPRDYREARIEAGRKYWRARAAYYDNEKKRHFVTGTLKAPRNGKGVPIKYGKNEPYNDDAMPIPCAGDRNKTAAEAAAKKWLDWLIACEEEAEAAEAAQEAERAAMERERKAVSVPDFVASFIDGKAGSYDPNFRGGGDIEPSTAYTYRKLNERIREGFEGVAMKDLDALAITDWLNEMEKKGVSASMRRKALVLLQSACKEAMIVNLLASNPCEKVRKPKVVPHEKNSLDEPTVAMLNGMLDRIGHTKMADAARIALHTGMRVGEICGLRWMDVDFDAGIITVQNAIGYSEGSGYEKPPKNGKARRIPIDSDLMKTLMERCDIVRGICDDMRIPFSKRMFVVGKVVGPDDVAGSHTSPSTISKLWGDFAEATGLRGVTGARPTFHDLRHTYATIAVRYNNDIESVAAILGHRDVSMTLNVYATALPDAVRATVDSMGAIMGRRAEPSKVLELNPTGTEGN